MSGTRSAKSIFVLAADLPPEARRAVLETHCEGRPDLRAEVESLLLHDPGSHALPDGELPESAGTAEPIPARGAVGPYIIHRLIAEGGSAAVYEAHQTSPERRVALKVLRRGESGELWRRRFEREAEILARLDHPGIAHFYAFGTTPPPESRAYIAMELVQGETITAFSKRHGLNLAQRLELLIQACDAAEYGHRRGVVHRDLKPGNILVSLEEGQDPGAARVRVVDFGVARMTQPGLDAPMTATGVLIGTPAYMSPEQIASGAEAVDARTDVYALGVLLYELACGRVPFGGENTAPIELLHRILEEQPTRLGLLDTSLRGDIEIIAAKALARDPKVRYQTAAQLADDLRRFIDKRPIQARRPSLGYVARSFVRRNRLLAGALGLAVLAMVSALAVVGWAAATSREQAARMAREAEFWQGLVASMWKVPGTSRVRSELLDQIIPHLEAQASENPGDGVMWRSLARAYANRSDVAYEAQRFAECRQWREKAYHAAVRAAAAQPRSVESQRELARVTVLLGDLDKEDGAHGPMFQRYYDALAIHERLVGQAPDDPTLADDLYWSYQRLADQRLRCGEVEEAERLAARQRAVGRRNHDRWPDDPRMIYAQSQALMEEAQWYSRLHDDPSEGVPPQGEEALVLAHRLATDERAGKQHLLMYTQFACWVAQRRYLAGRRQESEALLRECDAMISRERAGGAGEPTLDEARAWLWITQGNLLLHERRYSQAAAAFRECLAFARAAADAAPANAERRVRAQSIERFLREAEAASRSDDPTSRPD